MKNRTKSKAQIPRFLTECLETLLIICESVKLYLAKNFHLSQFVGVDTDGQAIEIAKTNQKKYNLTNVEFLEMYASDLPSGWANRFDWVVMLHSCHDFTRPDQVNSAQQNL